MTARERQQRSRQARHMHFGGVRAPSAAGHSNDETARSGEGADSSEDDDFASHAPIEGHTAQPAPQSPTQEEPEVHKTTGDDAPSKKQRQDDVHSSAFMDRRFVVPQEGDYVHFPEGHPLYSPPDLSAEEQAAQEHEAERKEEEWLAELLGYDVTVTDDIKAWNQHMCDDPPRPPSVCPGGGGRPVNKAGENDMLLQSKGTPAPDTSNIGSGGTTSKPSGQQDREPQPDREEDRVLEELWQPSVVVVGNEEETIKETPPSDVSAATVPSSSAGTALCLGVPCCYGGTAIHVC